MPGDQPTPATPAMIEARRQNATKHGASSEAKIRATARLKKRALLRRMNCRAGDLDVTSALLLDVVCRYAAKVELLDRFFDRTGIVQEDGLPAPALSAYLGALNGLRLACERFGESLRRQGDDHAGETLEGYIIEQYGHGNGRADE